MPIGDQQAQAALDTILRNFANGTYNEEQTLASLEDYYKSQGMSPELAVEWAADTFRTRAQAGVAAPGVDGKAPLARESNESFWKRVGFSEVLPQAAWQRGLGLPATGRNPFEDWLARQAIPAFAGWGAQAAARPLGITPIPGQAGQVGASPFANFVNPRGSQMGQSAAYGMLNQMRGQASGPQQRWLKTIGAEGGPGLEAVLEAGLQGKGYAGFVARHLANRVPELQTGWQAATEGGTQQGDTFLEYLLKNMGF